MLGNLGQKRLPCPLDGARVKDGGGPVTTEIRFKISVEISQEAPLSPLIHPSVYSAHIYRAPTLDQVSTRQYPQHS